MFEIHINYGSPLVSNQSDCSQYYWGRNYWRGAPSKYGKSLCPCTNYSDSV